MSARHRRYRYNLSEEKYNILLKEQKNRCRICGINKSKLNKSLVVDHNHDTGEVRGLLCSKCNLGLGQFNDNIETLENALRYLKNESC